MDATTTRASTVIRSMPTREMRTHASMTMPLSRTRSSTSIKLDPPETRSTAICDAPPDELLPAPGWSCSCRLSRSHRAARRGHHGDDGGLQRQVRIVFPPIEPNLLGLIHRANEQTNANRQQFHVRKRDPNVARDHQALVQDAVQNVYKVRRSGDGWCSFHGSMASCFREELKETASRPLDSTIPTPRKSNCFIRLSCLTVNFLTCGGDAPHPAIYSINRPTGPRSRLRSAGVNPN